MSDPLDLQRLGYVGPLLQLDATRHEGANRDAATPIVAEEVPIGIVYNMLPHVVMMGTPQDLDDFAVGFSVTEELIESAADILAVDVVRYSRGIELQVSIPPGRMAAIEARSRKLTGRTGCGICGAESFAAVLKEPRSIPVGPPIRFGAIETAILGLGQGQHLNADAGAIHAAGWAGPDGTIDLVREDVGRHNALDKLIGGLLRRGTDPATGFVVITSRASFEMVQKVVAFGAPLLAAISGPTGLAVRVARASGLTLVGFARGARATVYAGDERLTD